MSYNKIGNRVPVYALYGVPEDEAYGRANGGIPTAEAYSMTCKQSTESLNNSTKNQTGEQNNNSKICSYFQNSNNNSQSLSILPREENSYVANIKDNQNTANAFTPQTNNFSLSKQCNISQEQQPNVSAIISAQNNVQQTPSNYMQEIRKLLNKGSIEETKQSSSLNNSELCNFDNNLNKKIIKQEQTTEQSSKDHDIDDTNPAYIFSNDMRNLLGHHESRNNYKEVLNDGTLLGAIGRYQFRAPILEDIGYLNKKHQWTGKNNIYSLDDFLKNQQVQENALNECLRLKDISLKNNGSYNYLGYSIKGIKSDFNISKTGLLAASHRLGAKNVINYLKLLEKDSDGKYYFDYDKIKNEKTKNKYKAIETRLREFEK